MRHLLIPTILFVGFFILFWNVRRWNLPTTKKIGLVFACAAAAAIATVAFGYAFIVVFN